MASTTDDFVDSTIASLKVIGMVPKNGKLCVRNGQLCIDMQRIQGVRRWINGDSRSMTLVYAKTTVNNAIKIARSIILNCIGSQTCNAASQWTLSRILEEMETSEQGLHNLKTTTYVGDSMMVANLDVIIERLGAYRDELTLFIKDYPLEPKDTETKLDGIFCKHEV
jgi:hypothetical protein